MSIYNLINVRQNDIELYSPIRSTAFRNYNCVIQYFKRKLDNNGIVHVYAINLN